MSKALNTLARLQRAQIDEAKIELAEIVAARASIAERQASLEIEIAQEQAMASRDADARAAYGGYAPRVAQEKRAMAETDARLAGEEAVLRERLSAAYIELKKIEHLMQAQAERERLAENARELASMDEAAAMRAARRV
ncbi:MAG: flagellar FliJ family protein [Alphaproteobacteria bacterium]|nr:flagellar FliJ family protein [Alphaproteobacteria bacterium]